MKAGVKYLSLYTFSQENWKRPEKEVSAIMSLMSSNIVDALPDFLENKIRFRVIGDRSRISEELNRQIEDAEKQTAAGSDLTMILLFSYSGKWDIEQAAKRFAADYGTPAAKPFESYLATAGIPDPDLLIRTGGEQRISNYMLWQCAYTEFYFTDKLWPDFREDEFNDALNSFRGRDRRYGKVK
jgi:undecaprenyl diphosphate synthase